MNEVVENMIMHYGVKRRSGRYEWGSGEDPYQHEGDFVSRFQELRKSGLSETEIATSLGFKTTTDLRAAYRQANNERKRLNIDRAKSLRDDGLGPSEIGRQMGVSESTVRSWLNETREINLKKAEKTAEILKEEIAKKGTIDVGAGVERELGISRNKLDEALNLLTSEGYIVEGIGVPQATNPKKRTTVKVIHDSSVTTRDLYQDPSKIQSFGDYASVDDGGRWYKREYPASISSDRIKIKYGDEGPAGNTGSDKDGVIEIRPGVKDLNLGASHYAQVRILVDGTHYLKGMAMYSDDIPDGVDIVFNTNKAKGTPKEKVMKEIQSDPDNPFGAYIKATGQSYYDDPNGNYTDPLTGKKQSLSAINKLKEEGDWDKSSKNLSQQFLSKQPISFIKKQLDLSYSDFESDYDDIMSIPNPTVRKKMLSEFAGKVDSATITLKAAALPRQQTRVILPVTTLKDNEVYAPYLRNGEKVVLVRYPHAGTFEIPTLTVNNNEPTAKKNLGNATDAIGINSNVAARLSGADFDGDTVIVIPVNSRVRVNTSKPLAGLENFDPKHEYPEKPGMKLMTKAQTSNEMGVISNLITDMTIRGAKEEELVRAVKHSMVVIDAAKHHLDYKQSEKDNRIAELKAKYQIKYDDEGNPIGSGGASTLLSRRKQTVSVPERKGSPHVDKETGKLVYKETGRTYVNKKGETVQATNRVPLVSTYDDMRKLSSGSLPEEAYAEYGNKLKALADRARKESVNTKGHKYSATAAKIYKKEVDRLNAALEIAEKNAPRERRAQAITDSVVKAKIQDNPELADKAYAKELAKVRSMALEDARASVGASGKKSRIDVSDKEWEAIQAGAISATKLGDIMRYMDDDKLKERAMPRASIALSTAKQTRLKNMKNSGYTIAQIADALGVSTSTVSKYLNV